MDNLGFIILIPAAGLILYALFIVFSPNSSQTQNKRKKKNQTLTLDSFSDFREQKIIKLESQLKLLEEELEKQKNVDEAERMKFQEAVGKYEEVKQELLRRQNWVAASEEMLNKAKAESLEFKNRFLEKEKESQEEFTKNVNLQKESRELNNKIGELNIKIKEQ